MITCTFSFERLLARCTCAIWLQFRWNILGRLEQIPTKFFRKASPHYYFLEKFVSLSWQWLLWNYCSQSNLQSFRMACIMTKFPQKAKPFSLFLIKPKCMHLPSFLHQKGQARGLLAICKTRRALVTSSRVRVFTIHRLRRIETNLTTVVD